MTPTLAPGIETVPIPVSGVETRSCEWCGSPITRRRSHAQFCSARCRRRAWAAAHDMPIISGTCHGCGAQLTGRRADARWCSERCRMRARREATTNVNHPLRIRRLRVEGWRKPADAVIVDRTSRWGNPYKLIEHDGEYTRDESLRLYEHEHLPARPDLLAQLVDLAGKQLACTCPLDEPCHGDVLARMANGGDAR